MARLEEIQTSDIELSGQQQVVQYRGEIMPLISLAEYGQIESEDGTVSLVVHNTNGRNIGVVVGRIIDIVNHEGDDSDNETRIIAGRVTRIVDLERLAAGA